MAARKGAHHAPVLAYLQPAERDLLDAAARAAGLSRSALVRQLILAAGDREPPCRCEGTGFACHVCWCPAGEAVAAGLDGG
jgi:hypothetical protein